MPQWLGLEPGTMGAGRCSFMQKQKMGTRSGGAQALTLWGQWELVPQQSKQNNLPDVIDESLGEVTHHSVLHAVLGNHAASFPFAFPPLSSFLSSPSLSPLFKFFTFCLVYIFLH